jgi:branched-chain amino acid transport system permease protein
MSWQKARERSRAHRFATLNGRATAARSLRPGRVLAALLLAIAALCPFFLNEFKVGLIALGLTYGLFAVGLDLAWGRAGIISIGHAVFFGLGVYGVAIAMARDVSPLAGAAAGIVLAALLGVAIAAAGLRRSTNPSTMAVLTLAVTLLAEKIARSWWSVTGGSTGIFVQPIASTDAYYWFCLAATTVVVGALWLAVLRRPFGNRLVAIRLNSQRAEHLGIPVYRERVVGFALSAAVSALAGSLAAPLMSSVSPDRVGIVLSTQVLVWVAIGGKGTILGPILGAMAATYGQDALATWMGDSYLLLLGVLFIGSVLLVPAGIAGQFQSGPQLADAAPPAPAPARASLPRGGDGLVCEGVVKRFSGNIVLDGVDLRVPAGEIVCLIGPNGAGKSTLLNILSGAIACDAGSVTLRGMRVESQPPHRRIAAGLARTFQIPSLFPGLSVSEHLVLARREAGVRVALPEAYARLEREHGERRVEDLSLSDRRSLEIAMALCANPAVLLLDEPAAGLARNEANRLARTLRALRDELGCAIVCVEHDMEIVRDLADRVVCLHRGRIISEGSMDAVSADPEVRRAYLGLR